jgi:hypothetical protein
MVWRWRHRPTAVPDPVAPGAAFAADFLLWRIPVLWSALDSGSARPGRRARSLDALLVSVGCILIMIGLAWLLERTEKVPAVFVETSANLPDATNKAAAA